MEAQLKQLAESTCLKVEDFHQLKNLMVNSSNLTTAKLDLWFPQVMKNVCSLEKEIREAALECFSLIESDDACKKSFKVIAELGGQIQEDMIKLLESGEGKHALCVWETLIAVSKQELHKSRPLLNKLLVVLEQAFKSLSPIIQIAACQAWKGLISNFALDKSILSNTKRIKLLIQPLARSRSVAENVWLAKLDTWWFLACKLDQDLPNEFDKVCLPLLNGAFIAPKKQNPRLLNSSNSFSENPQPENVQRKGCEMLFRILEVPAGISSPKKTPLIISAALNTPLPNSIFVKHIKDLLGYCTLALDLFNNNSQTAGHALHLLALLTQRTASVYRDDFKDGTETVALFLHFVQKWLRDGHIPLSSAFKVIDDVVRGLPDKIFSSHCCHKVLHRLDVMNGIPALDFITLLLEDSFFTYAAANTTCFTSVFQRLVSAGLKDGRSSLSFISFVLDLLGKRLKADAQLVQGESDLLHTIWASTANSLWKQIEETQDVNQGDNLEHDFSCLLSSLIFPLQQFSNKPSFKPTVETVGLKAWESVCRSFFRFAAVVDSVEANCACEELCNKILLLFDSEPNWSPGDFFWKWLCHILVILLECIDFQSVNSSVSTSAPSPAGSKRKCQPLGNLTSFVTLLGRTLHSLLLNSKTECAESGLSSMKAQKNAVQMSPLQACMDAIKQFFSYVTNSTVLVNALTEMKPALVALMTHNSNSSEKVVSNVPIGSLEELWQSLVNVILNRYQGGQGQAYFDLLCPLLEVTLLHPHRPIIEKSRQLWLTSFASHYGLLSFPESFKAVLKQISPPLVPGYASSTDENTPEIILIPEDAPKKGTKKTSSNLFSESPDTKSAKKVSKLASKSGQKMEKTKKSINDADDSEFVKIDSIKRGPTKILTEHQKEKMKQKSFVPALYNDLSQSASIDIDSQLSQFQSIEEPTVQDPKDVAKSSGVPIITLDSLGNTIDSDKEISQDQSNMSKVVDNIINDLEQSTEILDSISPIFFDKTDVLMEKPSDSTGFVNSSSFQLWNTTVPMEGIPEANLVEDSDKTTAIEPEFQSEKENSEKTMPSNVPSLKSLVEAVQEQGRSEEASDKSAAPPSEVDPKEKEKSSSILNSEDSSNDTATRTENVFDVPPKEVLDTTEIEDLIIVPETQESLQDVVMESEVCATETTSMEIDPLICTDNSKGVKYPQSKNEGDLATNSSSDKKSEGNLKKRLRSAEVLKKQPKSPLTSHSKRELSFPKLSKASTQPLPLLDLENSDDVIPSSQESSVLLRATLDTNSGNWKIVPDAESQQNKSEDIPKGAKRGRKRKKKQNQELLLKKAFEIHLSETQHSTALKHKVHKVTKLETGSNLDCLNKGESSKDLEPVVAKVNSTELEQVVTSGSSKESATEITSTDLLTEISAPTLTASDCVETLPDDSSKTELNSDKPELKEICSTIEISDSGVCSQSNDKSANIMVSSEASSETVASEQNIDAELPLLEIDFAVCDTEESNVPELSKESFGLNSNSASSNIEVVLDSQTSSKTIDQNASKLEKDGLKGAKRKKITKSSISTRLQTLTESPALRSHADHLHGVQKGSKIEKRMRRKKLRKQIPSAILASAPTTVVLTEIPEDSSKTNGEPMEKITLGECTVVLEDSKKTAGSTQSPFQSPLEKRIDFITLSPERRKADMKTMNGDSESNAGSPTSEKKKSLTVAASPLSRSQKMLQAAMKKAQHSPKGTKKRNATPGSPSQGKHIYSPMASPSGSILKGKRHSHPVSRPENSPSPNSKKRRVSFADPPVAWEVQILSQNKSPQSESSVIQETPIPEETEIPEKLPTSQKESDTVESQLSNNIVEDSEEPTESQMQNFEQLQKCTDSIEGVVNFLTSSFWTKPLLNNLMEKGIKSIGDLSKMTIKQIRALPLTTPKIDTYNKALSEHLKCCTLLTKQPEIEKMVVDNNVLDENQSLPMKKCLTGEPSSEIPTLYSFQNEPVVQNDELPSETNSVEQCQEIFKTLSVQDMVRVLECFTNTLKEKLTQ